MSEIGAQMLNRKSGIGVHYDSTNSFSKKKEKIHLLTGGKPFLRYQKNRLCFFFRIAPVHLPGYGYFANL